MNNDYFDDRELPDDSMPSNTTNPSSADVPQPGKDSSNSKLNDADGPEGPKFDPPAKPAKKSRKGCILTWFLLILFVGLTLTVWLRYCNPYTTDARVTGYITDVEKRGLLFKTYEGQMISESNLTDTARVYSRDFAFSIADTALVHKMQAMQGTGRPVTVVYKRYYGTLPWRGASTNVAVDMIAAPAKTAETPADSVAENDSL